MSQLPVSDQLLGFDAREAWMTYDEAWPEDRRARYLLRTDLEKPLSVDRAVWPSLVDHVVAGSSTNPLGLQNSVEVVRQLLAKAPKDPGHPYSLVAATLAVAPRDELEAQSWAPIVPLLPADGHASSWDLLGYDVADLALTSGLMNSGYRPADRAALQARWIPRLNRFHLLTDRDDAIEFQIMSDQRVPEHAPFFVYGLYRL